MLKGVFPLSQYFLNEGLKGFFYVATFFIENVEFKKKKLFEKEGEAV